MARPTHVPKFGNWDANDQVPFTKVFDSARAGAGKGQKMINPNDPAENPEAFGGRITKDRPPYQVAAQKINNSFRSRHDRKSDTEDGEMAPGRNQQSEAPGRRMLGESMQNRMEAEFKYQNQQGRLGVPPKTVTGDAPRRNPYPGEVSESINSDSEFTDNSQVSFQSPSPQFQGLLKSKPGEADPGWERKVPAEGGPPRRAHLGSKSDETLDRGSPLPLFGAWNGKDSPSGEGFTVIFNNNGRNEKKTGGPIPIPSLQSESPVCRNYSNRRHQQPTAIISQHKPPSMWRCCFCDLSSSK